MNFLKESFGESSKVGVSDIIYCVLAFNIDLAYDFVSQQFILGTVGLFSSYGLADLGCNLMLVIWWLCFWVLADC